MADVERGVLRLFETSKNNKAHSQRAIGILHGGKQISSIVSPGISRKGKAKCPDDFCKILHTQGVRLRMNAPHDGDIDFVEKCGNGFVCFDHEHFNHRMRVAVVGQTRIDNPAGLIHYQFRFGQMQMQHAVGEPSLLNHAAEFFHVLQQANHFGLDAFATTAEDLVRLLVGQALRRTTNRVRKIPRDHIALLVVREICAFTESFLSGLEAANAVAQNLRQHRDGFAGQINTVASILGLHIER